MSSSCPTRARQVLVVPGDRALRPAFARHQLRSPRSGQSSDFPDLRFGPDRSTTSLSPHCSNRSLRLLGPDRQGAHANPVGGQHDDRAALEIIEHGVETGEKKPDLVVGRVC